MWHAGESKFVAVCGEKREENSHLEDLGINGRIM
jgi:hypothetical protein